MQSSMELPMELESKHGRWEEDMSEMSHFKIWYSTMFRIPSSLTKIIATSGMHAKSSWSDMAKSGPSKDFPWLTKEFCMKETGVQISNVIYKEVLGTSTTEIAININCSRSVPCFGISMESIQLLSADVGKEVTANCSNAYGQEVDVVPAPCLSD
ncbi:UNVERIFIED_CONTAM: putative polygalacturonase [Sesamum angustifolium]|uniref:Polygalacturonase n=1 Tax=Sesamum angustifolium TaxID=2727405 RepID=A0AAW2MTT6_9LAMI